MDEAPERDRLHLRQIVELIDLIRATVAALDEVAFASDRDKLDVTAFRLSLIGEATNKLSADLRRRHPEIAWKAIYGMRNIIAHHYAKTRPDMIWATATDSLDALDIVCRKELERLDV